MKNKRINIKTRYAASGALLLWSLSLAAMACPAQPLIGGMCVFGGNFAPRNWAMAQGQLLPISTNTALFSLLGTTYGGDGRTTFALPDLRGRSAIGQGNGPGLSNIRMGERGGVDFVTLTVLDMPSHSHNATTTVDITLDSWTIDAALQAHDAPGSSTSPSGGMLAQNSSSAVYAAQAPDVSLSPDALSASVSSTMTTTASTTLTSTGASQSHENRMPYLAVNWIIALYGIYPSRD
ncbi:phage tail protein [Alteromonas sp. CYL-A6]|uniref:phage tail protein n=1 Tax=Alteromonas nitratireducens TaxID=3390813 RepID=UPI0034AF888C